MPGRRARAAGYRVEAAPWLDRLDPTRTFNAPDLARWNLEKTYLNDLAARGAPLPASIVVDADASAIVGALGHLALADAVIKPTVGASGVGVERLSRGGEADALARLRAVAKSPPVFIGGALSHGLRRVPAAGEFRVNSQYGGRLEAAELDGDTIGAMTSVLRLLPGEPPYARIDGVRREGRFLLMEVEVNEPGLGLQPAPGAGDRFAEPLRARLRVA